MVGLAALVLYAPTWGYGTLNYDDAWLVRNNPLLSDFSLSTFHAIFFDLSRETRFILGSEYLPMRDLSIALDYAIFGPHFGAFHVTQTILYALACALLFVGIWRWTRRTELAVFAIVIFATHPLHVESVAWLSERKGVLGLFFFACTLLTFHRFMHSARVSRSLGWFLVSTLSATAALWSKALTIALLGVLLVLVLLFCEGRLRRRGLIGLTLLTPILTLAFIPVWVAGKHMEMVSTFHGGSFAATTMLAAKTHALYLSRAALWGEYGIAYSISANSGNLGAIILGSLGVLVGLLALVYGLTRAWRSAPSTGPDVARPLALGAALWLGFLLPVSHLLFPLQNVAADRYTLLPTLGWSIALAGVLNILSHPALRRSLLLLLCVVQCAATLTLSQAWRSDEMLYRQALRAYPTYLPAMLQLSRIERERGALDEAQRWIDQAHRVTPKDSRVSTHRGLLWLARGNASQAISHFRRALKGTDAYQARANLALLLLRRGKKKEALKLAREAAQLRPLDHHTQHTLGVVAIQNWSLNEAEAALGLAVRLKTNHAPTHYNLAVLAHRRGKHQAAKTHLKRALSLTPNLRGARRLQHALFDPSKGGK